MKRTDRDLMVHVVKGSKPFDFMVCGSNPFNEFFQLDGTQERVTGRLSGAGYIVMRDAHTFAVTPRGFVSVVTLYPPSSARDMEYRVAAAAWFRVGVERGIIDPSTDFPEGYDAERMISGEFVAKAPKKGQAPKTAGNGKTGERFVKSRVKCALCRSEGHNDLGDIRRIRLTLRLNENGRPVWKGMMCDVHRRALREAGGMIMFPGGNSPAKREAEKPKRKKSDA